MEPRAIIEQTILTLDEIDRQIREMDDVARAMNLETVQLRDPQGNWPLVPLLGAKAQCLHALAILETEGDPS